MKRKNFIIISLAVVLILIGLILITYGQSNKKVSQVSNVEPRNEEANQNGDIKNTYFGLFSRYSVGDNPDFFVLFNSEHSLERLKQFNEALNKKYSFFEFSTQSLEFRGYYSGDKKFAAGDDECVNQEIDLEGNRIILTPLKTYMIGKLYQDELKNYIEEGRNFENDDYIINDPNQEISIILGNEYKDVYKLGDVITISLHEKPLKFKVIGFFEKNTKIYINGGYLFDQSIIMPYYNITYDPVDDTDEIYQKIYYSQKNEGFIKINGENTDDIETVKANYINKVEELARKYDLLYTIIGSPFSINFRQK